MALERCRSRPQLRAVASPAGATRGRPCDLDRAWELSRRYDHHPVYDMVYVALAERLGRRLVTADGHLQRRLAMLAFVVSAAEFG
jgi:hypothetical protein